MKKTKKISMPVRQPQELVEARMKMKSGAQTTKKGAKGYDRKSAKATTKKEVVNA